MAIILWLAVGMTLWVAGSGPRVVWEHDGEEWIDGTARRWTQTSVYVTFPDDRLQLSGVWLAPADVQRR